MFLYKSKQKRKEKGLEGCLLDCTVFQKIYICAKTQLFSILII